MINVDEQIVYWRENAIEDLGVSKDLLRGGKVRHGLFFLHLACEKMLKTHVCKATQDLAPRTHDLVGLGARTTVKLTEDHRQVPDDLNAFNIEGQYPSMLTTPPSLKEARDMRKSASVFFKWLTKEL